LTDRFRRIEAILGKTEAVVAAPKPDRRSAAADHGKRAGEARFRRPYCVGQIESSLRKVLDA
jgi:hypothetical protein